jgi:hypothetical protein
VPEALPHYLLFAQHGWADDNQAMQALAMAVVGDDPAEIIAPSLNYAQTWLRIEPLVDAVEQIALSAVSQHPSVPLRIIGHSMGGLIWLEVLNRHRPWWPQVNSLVLLAAPVGGADLGRIVDPLGLGIGIAADLGQDRKPLCQTIAASIPTLVIAGDLDQGSDGTIPIESTKVPGAQFVCLEGLAHPELRNHAEVVSLIRQFWAGESVGASLANNPVIQWLRSIPGMTDGHLRHFNKADIFTTFPDGSSLRLWQNPLGVLHVFLVSPEGACLYSGFVGWIHQEDLWQALKKIELP